VVVLERIFRIGKRLDLMFKVLRSSLDYLAEIDKQVEDFIKLIEPLLWKKEGGKDGADGGDEKNDTGKIQGGESEEIYP